nr:nucleoside 2-deoxyribosyltransferase domain-containing protein [Kibdelosporangium phytohabitans]
MAREPIPAGPSVFLAGPTPARDGNVPSWRPDAAGELAEQWAGGGPLTVLSPESRGGIRAEMYEDQVDWETAARRAADAILFWVPRCVDTLPGFTTNVEFGLDAPTGRVVLGCPPDCPNPERNRYLIHIARRLEIPVRETLRETVSAALSLVNRAVIEHQSDAVTGALRLAIDDLRKASPGAFAHALQLANDSRHVMPGAYLVELNDRELVDGAGIMHDTVIAYLLEHHGDRVTPE